MYGDLGSYRLTVLAFHSRHGYKPLLTKFKNINNVHKFDVDNGFVQSAFVQILQKSGTAESHKTVK